MMSRRCQNDYQKKHPGFAKIEHMLHKKTDLILTNSRRLSHELAGKENVPLSKGYVHPQWNHNP